MQAVFKPNFSTSTYYLFGGILMIPFLSLLFVIYFASKEGEAIEGLMIGGIVCIPLILCLSFYMLIYHTMCYKLQGKELVLKCSIFSSKIQYKKIKKITKIEKLSFSPLGLLRCSKYSLGSSYFVKYGWITMYATNLNNVLLIETDKKCYGITPKDEDNFLRILNERLKEGR